MDLVTGFIHCVLCTPFNTTSHIAPITKPHPGAKHVGLRDFFFFFASDLLYFIFVSHFEQAIFHWGEAGYAAGGLREILMFWQR